MEEGKMVLIAYHMLGSSTSAYIGWLVKELKMTANKTEYKDAQLVMLILRVFSFLLSGKSC
jgi:hypothetical protein